MKRLFSKISGRGGSSWLKLVLLSFFLFAALVLFKHGIASEPDQEHPWDDLCGSDADQIQIQDPGNHFILMLPIGIASQQIVVHVESDRQKDKTGKEKVSQPSVKNRIHFFIFIKWRQGYSTSCFSRLVKNGYSGKKDRAYRIPGGRERF